MRTQISMTAEENERYAVTNIRGGVCDIEDRHTGMLWKNAPMADVQEYIDWQVNRVPVKAEAQVSWWDLENYEIVSSFQFRTGFVLLMASKKQDDPLPWCIRSVGQKHRIATSYFRDIDSLLVYTGVCLFKKRLTYRQHTALRALYWRCFNKHTPFRWRDWQMELEAMRNEKSFRGRERTAHALSSNQ